LTQLIGVLPRCCHENFLSGLTQDQTRFESLRESGGSSAEAIEVPVVPRLIAEDITPETAASLLADHGGQLAVLSDEGGILGTITGSRYSAEPNLDVFLKGHSANRPLRVDRKGRAAEHVERPTLTLGIAPQPDVLIDLARIPGARGRGLLARILYSLPENTVGRRKVDPPPVPREVAESYDTNLQAMVCSLAEWTDPAVLPLTPEANQLVLDLQAEIEPRLHPVTGDLGHIADWGSKFVGATIRIAGLLHLAAHLRAGWGHPITANAVSAAIRIGRYYLNHALAVFDYMGADPLIDDAQHILDWITRTRRAEFTRRELFSALDRGRFKKVGDLDPALTLLEQHGHIRQTQQERTGRAGRPPSPRYQVHPQHHSAESAQSAKPPGDTGSADTADNADTTSGPGEHRQTPHRDRTPTDPTTGGATPS
ncbi:MAG: DUF3987 domain-containing protein, partial [Propionibacteriales bacterium]|nr:DUF3987 domain-containing protein [Propionibacteriales bacterium]